MHDARIARTNGADLDDLAVALARWLDAAQAVVDSTETRLAALEEARHRLAAWAGGPR